MKPAIALLSLSLGALVACASPKPAPVAPRPVARPAPAKAPDPSPNPLVVSSGAISPGAVFIGEVAGTPKFDPMKTLTSMKPVMLACYTAARVITPDLHGKVTLNVHVNATGTVNLVVAQAGGGANDPGLVGCIAEAMKSTTFQKPGGVAVLTVPMLFRP